MRLHSKTQLSNREGPTGGRFARMNADTSNIAELYETEHGRLRSFVRRIVGSSAAAEDVVQQAFANILGKADPASPPSVAYIVQAVRNLALNHLRDMRRRRCTGIGATIMSRRTSGVAARATQSPSRGARSGRSPCFSIKASLRPVPR